MDYIWCEGIRKIYLQIQKSIGFKNLNIGIKNLPTNLKDNFFSSLLFCLDFIYLFTLYKQALQGEVVCQDIAIP